MKLITLISAIIFLSCVVSNAQKIRPNIILIVTDQHSGLVMEQQGYNNIKTPGINKLADKGVTFLRSYCAYPVCVASRASMITGRMASKSNTKKLTSYPSIGMVMKNSGYTTAFLGKWHVSHTKIEKVADWHGFEKYHDERMDTITERMTIDYLKQKHDKPFFLVTSFLNPHDCCELARNISNLNDNYHDGAVVENEKESLCPPLPANFMIAPREAEGFYCRRAPDSTDMKNYRKHPVKYWSAKQWRQYMYGYDRLVEKSDNHVLNVFNTLKKQGLLKNTIIFYTSDHGDGHASHQWNQKMSFYEEVLNIPFIVSWQGHTRTGVVDDKTLVCNGVDLFPTICSVAGAKCPKSLSGRDLSPYFLKKSYKVPEKRDYIVSEIIQRDPRSNSKNTFVGRAVVSENFKYILFDNGKNPEQLFDLKKDPGELHPVNNNPKYKKQLNLHRQYLRNWIKKTGNNFSPDNIPCE